MIAKVDLYVKVKHPNLYYKKQRFNRAKISGKLTKDIKRHLISPKRETTTTTEAAIAVYQNDHNAVYAKRKGVSKSHSKGCCDVDIIRTSDTTLQNF